MDLHALAKLAISANCEKQTVTDKSMLGFFSLFFSCTSVPSNTW